MSSLIFDEQSQDGNGQCLFFFTVTILQARFGECGLKE
jgi:hypothetical protein